MFLLSAQLGIVIPGPFPFCRHGARNARNNLKGIKEKKTFRAARVNPHYGASISNNGVVALHSVITGLAINPVSLTPELINRHLE